MAMVARRLAFALVFLAFAGAARGQDAVYSLQDLSRQMKAEQSSVLRHEMAAHIASISQSMSTAERQSVSDETIDALVELLAPRYSGTIFIATALGNLGPRAERALPALEEALRLAQRHEANLEVRPTVSHVYALQHAIARIREERH
jgi:hypothetical protein